MVGTAENAVCFHKLTLFTESLLRSIENQLVLSEGKLIKIVSAKHKNI